MAHADRGDGESAQRVQRGNAPTWRRGRAG